MAKSTSSKENDSPVGIFREKARQLIDEDPDFINAPAYSNSLKKFLKESKIEAKDSTIAKMLMMTTEEFKAVYESALKKLRIGLEAPERKV